MRGTRKCNLSGFTGSRLAWVLLAAGCLRAKEGFCPKIGQCKARFEALSYPLAMKLQYSTAQERSPWGGRLRASRSLGLSRGK